jgi:hypothetical protein
MDTKDTMDRMDAMDAGRRRRGVPSLPCRTAIRSAGPLPLRVLAFFVHFVLFVVRSGSPVRLLGPDEPDRRRRDARSVTTAHTEGTEAASRDLFLVA